MERIKRMLAPVAVALAAVGKWALPLLKFGWPLFKMGGFMLLSLWFYARAFGWPFAVGFIVLLFIHEMGHVLAARIVGLKVSLPLFIPFLGALITLREAPRNAWVESVVGIGGPLLGSAGALAVGACYDFTGNPLFLGLAYTGFFLNLFNLIPIVPLDGGRIVSAISPWFWLVGFVVMVGFLILHTSAVSFIILLIVLTSFPRVIALFRRRTPEQMRYFECTPAQRTIMAVLYFGLMASLYFGMGFIKKRLATGDF
jgi:Zn-dependent protease